jgi:hypothetical protein
MNPLTFWILFLAPAVVLVLWRVTKQRDKRVAYLKRLIFRVVLSVLIYQLYGEIVNRFDRLLTSESSVFVEQAVRYTLFWLLDAWCIGFFDRDTYRVR